jgi:peroxiredoxin
MSGYYKYFLFLTTIVWLKLAACQSSPSTEIDYQIFGNIEKGMKNGSVILSQFNPVTQVKTPIDTGFVNDQGDYKLTYTFNEPDLFHINFNDQQSAMLVIGEGQSNVQLDVEGSSKGWNKVKGSIDSEKLLAYDKFRLASNARVVRPTYDAMRAASKAGNHEAEIEAVENYAHASESHRVELIDFTTNEIGTSLALYGSMLRWTGDEEIGRLDKLVKDFKKAHPNLKMTKVMEEKVERFKKVALGAITPNIELPDSSGKKLTLQDLKGKYTLIDFWASWCTPCILQIPDLKAAHSEFQDKGFEIIGVSIDNRDSRWKKALKKQNMPWPHISDLKGYGSAAATDYNVTFIPFNVLIDKDGMIIAKNLHSKGLRNKLVELLN